MEYWLGAGLLQEKRYILCPVLHPNNPTSGRRLPSATVSLCLFPQSSILSYNLRDKEEKVSEN